MKAIFIVPFVLALAGSASADVYVFKDANGIQHYTNVPNGDEFALIVAVLQQEGPKNQAEAAPVEEGVVQFASYIEDAAKEFDVDKALVHAVITAESGYNPQAVSRTGAQGLMQLMPKTAQRFAVTDPFDPADNIRGGTRYLKELLRLFGGDIELTVAAYNAGENAVIKYGRQVPPYRETRAYVPKVVRLYNKYKTLM